jgi:ribosomal protein S18 acetylase RimI-like enzyme
MKVKVRPLRLDDIRSALAVERSAWPPPWPQEYVFTAEHLRSQIAIFQEGLIGAFVDEEVVGFVTTEIINSEFLEQATTWDQITDRGFIRQTHDPKGDTMYGVNLSVHPRFARKGIAEQLLFAEGRLAIKKCLKRIVLGGRLPRYHRYAKKMTVEEYIFASYPHSGKPLDPELYLYMKAGLKVVKVLPDYIPDPESLNYGVLLEWRNPFYGWTKYCKPLGRVFSVLVRL